MLVFIGEVLVGRSRGNRQESFVLIICEREDRDAEAYQVSTIWSSVRTSIGELCERNILGGGE